MVNLALAVPRPALHPPHFCNIVTACFPALLRAAVAGLFAVLSILAAETATAQQNMNPFAGSIVPGAPGPYGSAVGAYVHLLQNFQTMLSGTPQMLSSILSGAMPSPVRGEMGASGVGGDGGGKKADAPDAPDSGESLWEIVIGACAGGAFLGGYSAASAAAPVAATGVGAAPVGTAIASAAAIGCGLGVATAAVSLGAVSGWRSILR